MTVAQLLALVLALALLAYVLWPLLPARGGAVAGECPVCGPRPEQDARFCSNCGRPLSR
ncbi:MAG TPA: hypothetical protein VFK16_10575 [Gemmatimonadaceae bacterium]|jgi:predicted amidophosphoribosyltransferase|nr:hypothetical protein [Gemmatimonadaceae bacterium]